MPALLALEDFSKLQARYQTLGLAERAKAVLKDAKPVLQTAERILSSLAAHPGVKQIFTDIRKNPALVGKMRPSEAKTILLDDSNDFIVSALHKLTSWRKTMERVSQGEGIVNDKGREYIPGTMSVAMALLSVSTVDAYLAVIQLALMEMAKKDPARAGDHQSNIVKIRRCATLISDYDHASSIRALIH